MLLAGLGRFVQDLLLWCTAEFGYLRLGDGFVQGSSIMPQKRNPVALEHARAIGSKALGQAQAIVTDASTTRRSATSSTPRTTCSRSCSSMFRDATRAVTLVAAAMRTAEFDARAARGARRRRLDDADRAGRHAGARSRPAFQTAHAIAGRLMAAQAADAGRPPAELLAEVSRGLTGAAIRYSEEELAEILSPRHFVNVRRTWGGPAPEETARATQASRIRLEADGAWLGQASEALQVAEARLAGSSAAL